MTTLQTRQLAVLEETAKFYNINNRCSTGYSCKYYLTEHSHGCAIGRLLPDEEARKKFDSEHTGSVCDETIFDALPTDIKELGMSFLTALQALHDYGTNWNAVGLTVEGLSNYDSIKHLIESGQYEQQHKEQVQTNNS